MPTRTKNKNAKYFLHGESLIYSINPKKVSVFTYQGKVITQWLLSSYSVATVHAYVVTVTSYLRTYIYSAYTAKYSWLSCGEETGCGDLGAEQSSL